MEASLGSKHELAVLGSIHTYSAIRNQCHPVYFCTHMYLGRTGRGLHMTLLDRIKPRNKRAIAFSMTWFNVCLFPLIIAYSRVKADSGKPYADI
jgi:hypothetical protein